ncbi:hypothetical protein [Rugamonas aquatica]|uniref:Uncharacterized protein n=1 Tax=Rugamonas aquatica TaxID=2743357 RepID=A0A6A7MUZ8_9BURK|nr:hypothetical protein [Rugamonas aquatica]MQA36755.1 hypothetical protein [Rugamonas aquatica]
MKSRTKHYLCLFVAFFFATYVNSSAAGVDTLCAGLPAKKNTVLLNENGSQIDRVYFDAGDIPFSQMKNEFIFSKEKYHLILTPKTRTIENDCSMSVCVKVTQVTSKCGNANEYDLSFGISPKKSGPGLLKTEFELKISDNAGPDSDRQGFSFEETITGSFAIPWLVPVRSSGLAIAALSLFQPTTAEVEVSLKNTGAIDYKFGSWTGESKQNKDYELIPGNCKNISLAPNASCSVKIRKLTAAMPDTVVLEWWNTFEGEDVNVRLQFEKINTSKIGTNVYNLE